MTQRAATMLAIAGLALATALPAAAQDAPRSPTPSAAAGPSPGAPAAGTQASTQNASLNANVPVVRLFGLPAQWEVNAPVDPPYAPTAYRTLGGQAETSADAVAEQNVAWH